MNDPLDALSEAIDGVLRNRDGEIYGRIGWFGLLLVEQRPYVVASLPMERCAFITFFNASVSALRQRGYRITIKEFADPDFPGPYVRITRDALRTN